MSETERIGTSPERSVFRPNEGFIDCSDEELIVWLEDIEKFDYVREGTYWARDRIGRPSRRLFAGVGRVVGYATLRATAQADAGRRFTRRVFWLKPYDRDSDPKGVYRANNPGTPIEGVDPRTVRPGVPGERTERARRGAKP